MRRYNAPEAIRRLPIDLLRSQLYPRDPRLVAEAAQGYLDGEELPTYIPQRMGFTRWKTPPTVVAFNQNVASMLTGLEQQHLLIAQMQGAVVQPPIMSPAEAAWSMDANRLPQPSDNEDPAVAHGDFPIARNALPADRVGLTAEQLNAAVQDRDDEMARLRQEGHDKRAVALAQVDRLIGQSDPFAEGQAYNNPWFIE